jgi:predicted dienelactone hydrolase
MEICDDWMGGVQDLNFLLDQLPNIEAVTNGLQVKNDYQRIAVGGHSYGVNAAQLMSGAITIHRRFQGSAPCY